MCSMDCLPLDTLASRSRQVPSPRRVIFLPRAVQSGCKILTAMASRIRVAVHTQKQQVFGMYQTQELVTSNLLRTW